MAGYYATVLTVEYLGRKWIQIQGFLLAALFCELLVDRMMTIVSLTWRNTVGILAGRFEELSTVSFIVCFALLQFFFNFGANA